MVRRSRSGSPQFGCLVFILFVAAVLYFGFNIGNVYWRAYQFQDAMTQESRFAARNGNDVSSPTCARKSTRSAFPRARSEFRFAGSRIRSGSGASTSRSCRSRGRIRRSTSIRTWRGSSERSRSRAEGAVAGGGSSLARGRAGRVVFTNGVFDLLHVGHIDLLSPPARSVTASSSASTPMHPCGGSRARRAPCAPRPSAPTSSPRSRWSTPSPCSIRIRRSSSCGAAPRRAREGRRLFLDTIVGRTRSRIVGRTRHVIPLTAGHSTTRIIEALRAGS